MSESLRVDAGIGAVLEGLQRRAAHDVGVPSGQFEGTAEERVAPCRVHLGHSEERDVVQGGHHRCAGGRIRDSRGVDEVDRAGGPLHERESRPMPRLVQPESRQRDRPNGDRRLELGARRMAVGGGDADEFDAAPPFEGPGEFQRRSGGSAGHLVPALFERHRDPESRRVGFRLRRGLRRRRIAGVPAHRSVVLLRRSTSPRSSESSARSSSDAYS